MLKGIDPLLFPDLLKTLAEMGHDEAIVLTDANFSAMHVAAGKPLLRLPGINMARTIQAICSVFPLAADVECPIAYMQVSGTEPPYRTALQREVMEVLAPNLRKRGIHMLRYSRSDVSLSYFNMEDPVVGGYTADKVALRRAISLAADSAIARRRASGSSSRLRGRFGSRRRSRRRRGRSADRQCSSRA